MKENRKTSTTIKQIDVNDIDRNTQLIGTLGWPLGTVLVIKGKWLLPPGIPKDDDRSFEVFEVNGKSLSRNIRFGTDAMIFFGDVHQNGVPVASAVWEIDGYEDGEYVGVPRNAYTAAYNYPPQIAHTFGFRSRLRYYRVRLVE